MANIFTSSIGKKLIMSISGLFLIIFLLLHLSINMFSVIDTFTGNFEVGNADGLFALGCWFMSTPVITVMVPVLAFGFIIHIIYACYLTYCNIQTRGGYRRYEVSSKAKTESWASKNMFVLGIIVLGFIAFLGCHAAQGIYGRGSCRPVSPSYDHLQALVGCSALSRLVRRDMVPPYPRFLERIPDNRMEQPGMDQETQRNRLHFCNIDFPRIRSSRNQRLPAGKRTHLLI